MSIGFKNYPQRLKSVRCGYLFLSIPYGKGKVQMEKSYALTIVLYQSPMGKVKELITNEKN